jgi:hypothetical protein
MDAKEIDQKLNAAKEAAGGGELLVLETDVVGAEVLAFRVPKPAEWKRYRVEISSQDAGVKVTATSTLVFACIVFPTQGEFERLVEAHPGLIESCIGDLQEHAGAARVKKARKL